MKGIPPYLNHYDVPNPKDHNYGDMPSDYRPIEPGDVDAYGNEYVWTCISKDAA